MNEFCQKLKTLFGNLTSTNPDAVKLDSGELAQLSKEVRTYFSSALSKSALIP